MDTLKDVAKEKDRGEYYYKILDIPVTLTCAPTSDDDDEEEESGRDVDKANVDKSYMINRP